MNIGGGGAYTKGASKRKPSSLVLSKAGATPGGAGAVSINPRRNDFGGGSGGGRVGARGGQLQLQSVTRAPLATAAPASTNPAEQRNGGRNQQRSAAQPLLQRANNPASNNGYQNRGQRANHQQGGPQQQPRGLNLPVPGRGAGGGGRNEGGGVQVAAQATSRQASTGEPRAQPVRRHDAMAGRGRGQGQQASVSGPRTGEGQGGDGGQQQNGAARHPPQQRLQQQQQRPSHNNPYQQQRQSQPRHLPSNATAAAAAASRPNYKGPPPSNGIARAGGNGTTAPGRNRALSDSTPLPGARQAQEAGGVPPIYGAANLPASGVDAASLPPAGVLPPRQPPSAAPVSASASGAGAVGAVVTAAATAGAAVVPDGDAALRARLAEVEARHTAALARVQELEESNFELEASMQLIEVEASHRVEKQARALQSELSFKDHQLTAAQKSHTTAVRELNAERSKRKRDQQQADRQRAEAAASASAAASEAAAAAKAAAAATATAAVSADKSSREKAAVRRRRLRAAESTKDKEKPPRPTLADLVLAESSRDVMVLLNAGGAGQHSPCWGGGDGNANSSGSDGDAGGLWVQTPLGTTRRRGRGPYSPSSGATSDSVSPGRALGRGFGSGGGQDSGGTWRAGRKRDFSGASPLLLAFTPVRPAPWELRVGADESSAARRAPRSGSGHAGGGGGALSTGKSSSANWTNTASPRRFWAGTRGGEEVGTGGASSHGGRLLDELRCLSSRMFTCAIDLVEGEACAGDLLDVLVGFLETLSGEADGDLEVLASAVRLVHRTIGVTPPAAVAIAFGGNQHTTPRNGFPSAAAVTTTAAAAATVDSDYSVGSAEGGPQSIPPSGKGKKRARHELGVNGEGDGRSEKEDADDENTGDTERGRPRDGRSSEGGRRARLGAPAPCSLFIAGDPVTVRDVPAAPASVSSSRKAAAAAVGRQEALGIDRQGERREGEAWAGRCGGEGLGRRIKKQLVALFQRGATCGCSALVEACLQAILCVLWDRQDKDLISWGCLLDLDSFDYVMFSELHRSAWELGVQVLRVLTRNAVLFRRLATGERVSSLETTAGDPGGGNRAAGVSAAKSVTTEVTALPTPPSAIIRSFRRGGLAGDILGDTGAGGDGWDVEARGSFLRRLCLEAVDVGEHAAFGENVGLRLSVVRLAFGACQRYGAEAARPLFGEDGVRSENGGSALGGGGGGVASGRSDAGDEAGMPGLIPALVTFVRLELEDWERRRYSQPNPISSDRGRLLKEAFQLLWALAMHAPLPLRDMAQGAGRFNTMVSVVSRFYNSVETEEFQVHKEAMMLMEKMN